MAELDGDPAEETGLEIAIVGMAGRFPGADDVDAFWRNLRDGVGAIRFFTREEMLAAGADPALLDHPGFVPARGELRAADEIDAGLFGLTPRDAEILDPQHRVLLECAWGALEHAGYDAARVDRPVGVFAGCSSNGYMARLLATPELVRAVGTTRMVLGNEKDHLAAGISYRLNLHGPSLAVQTACSTSLVAVHLACQSLLAGECDMALAGGVSIFVPLRDGYLYVPGGITSPDGVCRAFDANAQGTVGGSGAGVVALRRLADALADGDTIHAVIRGSAINNDGAQKVGYTAPSVTGQARVISEALAAARVHPATVQYLETHGSGTPLGDAIELKALNQVLEGVDPAHRWAIGSVKASVGHLDAAAGVTGLIKTVLALGHRQIPPSLNCATPNPEIEAGGGRVFVNTGLRPWARNGTPRRAAVSSFGIGGTNAHAVLEEAPEREPGGPSRPLHLLVLSARTPTALAAAAAKLAAHLEAQRPALADAAFTLQTGRREMEHRLAVVCADVAGGAAALRAAAAHAPPPVPNAGRPVAFMFPGLGMHHVNMARGLYDAEPLFRAAVDECCQRLRPVLGSDLRDALYSPERGEEEGGGWDLRGMLGRGGTSADPLGDTRLAQPAVFVTEYALARLWIGWGVVPRALIGHSLGEYVAACIAGVMRLEDALRLVALRARLIDALPAGAMLAVPLGEAALRQLLPAALDVAAVNTAESCVVSGPVDDVAAFEAELKARGTVSRRLATRHAFHGRAMRAVAAELERLVDGFELREPGIPFVSNVTGEWISDRDATSPAYWARHLCQAVRFADGVATLRHEPGWALLEVGPGQTLGAWAMQHPDGDALPGQAVFSSLRHPHNRVPDLRFLLGTLGAMWAAGVRVDWAAFSAGERRLRIPLPGYPYERARYWVDPPAPAGLPRTVFAPVPAAALAAPGGGAFADAPDHKGPDPMDQRPAAVAAPSPRQETILARLREIACELTGIEADRVETSVDFFSAGFDSLLLLQAVQVIEKRVGVRLSLIELLEEVVTLDALAERVDRALPPETAIEPAASAVDDRPDALPPACALPAAPAPEPQRRVVAPSTIFPPAAASAPAGEVSGDAGAIERVIARQMELMREHGERQFEMMREQIAALRGALPADASSSSAGPAAPAANRASAPPAATHHAGASNGNGAHASIGVASDGHASNGHVSNGHASNGHAANGQASNGATGANGAASAPREVTPSPRARITPETFVAYQPLNTEAGGVSPVQKAYLDEFIPRYVARTRASKAHQARYHLALADSRVTARFRRVLKEILYPIVGDRARGSRVWDVDGNEYVDIAMGFGCNLFGHVPDFVERAIRDQATRGYAIGPQSADAGRAAALVCELGGVERAVFCNSGTEAVMGAVRAARALTGRSKVAMFAGSYHGWSDLVLGRPFTAGGISQVRPSAPGVPALPLGDVLMLDFDDPASLGVLARHMDELALVMVEPVQSRRPDLQPFAFLRELRRMTREAGVLLHFDELITGFRMGPGGAQEFFGVRADLVTYGKIVAGGLPMGVVAGTREAMSVFDGGLWRYGDDSYPTATRTLFAGAYFKHPVSMAVAHAILGEIGRRGPEMYRELNERTTRLVERINAFFEAGRYPITAAHFSSCFRFFFGPEVHLADLFNHHLLAEGIHVLPETGTHFLSTAHTDDDLEKVYHAVRASAEAMRRGGFIPPAPDGGRGTGPDHERPRLAVSAASADAKVSVDSTASVDTAAAGDAGNSVGSADSAASADAHGDPADSAASVDADDSVDAGDSADAPGPGAAEWREGGVRALPLTEGQRQLWFESQMGDDAALAYIEATAVRLTGALDEAALRSAITEVVARHATLRMTISPDGAEQRIHPPAPVELPRADFRGEPEESREAAVEAWLRDTARRPFDLVAGPLARFALAAVGQNEHLLVIAAHHAVLDGWSFSVIWDDLGALYAAAREGRPAALAPPPDHAAAVRAQAADPDPAAQAYWLAQFDGGVPVLELPTDRPRPAVRSYDGERVERVIGGELMHRLANAGRPHGLTFFNTLLSACFVWLGRLSGQHDVVVGTPAAGQAGRGGAAELVGYGINVLPLRARMDEGAPFLEHARAVRRALLGALEHQGFSFPRLVETLLKTRDPSRPPVFSAMLNLDRETEATFLGDLRAAFAPVFTGGAKVDVSLRLTEAPGALRLACEFPAALFDRETVEGWLAGFEWLLEQLSHGLDTPLNGLELLGPDERGRVLQAWNGPDRPRAETCLHTLFEAQAARTPHAAAIDFGGHTVTYARLDACANRIAHALRRRGVGPETRVALLMENGPELVAAILGVLKAGGAYVPLDTASPAERLAYILADSGAALVLADAGAPLPEGAPPVIHVTPHAFDGEPETPPASSVTPRNLVYVIYTSGSTGRPKGVLVEHRGVCNTIPNYVDAYGVHPAARVLHFAPVHFDASVTDLFTPLCAGATLVMAPRESLIPGPELVALLRERGVTHAKFTPSALAALPHAQLPRLEAIMTGGEACTAELVARWAPGRRFINGYGPTEGSVRVTAGDVSDGARTPDMGRPLANTRVYLADPALRPVPVGVAGELCIGGVQVARGYLGRPALTAEKFVPDPFGAAPGGRLYRTGDRVRWRHDGTLEFLGREDFQVKIRGYRIETGEIEAVLREHPGVRQALVVAREDEPGERRLVAYVAAPAADAPGQEALRDALRQRLPEYMVPSAIVVLDRLPATRSGKADRAALPVPERPATAPGRAAARTPVEEAIAGIWAEVLRLDRVGPHEDFFALGGHSLLATRVVSRVREALGVELPLRALFEGPTVAGLAARADALRRAGEPPAPPLVPAARDGALPLALAQERFWFLSRMPGSVSYIIPSYLRLEGELSVAALERALAEVVRRHEALRTTFHEGEHGPVQVVAPFAGFTLPVEDLSAAPAAERDALARRRADQEAEAPFDLSAGPLLRATLLRLAERDHLLLVSMHHAISDGWSLDVLSGELAALYRAFTRGEPSPLPPLPVQYADFALWQRARMDGAALERQLAWWTGRLSGAPALLELPADHPRSAVMRFRGEWEPVHLPPGLLRRLQALAGREGATLYMVVLAAFKALLARYAAVDDVVVGTTVAGRDRAEAEGLIGLFMNTLALRTDLSGDPPFTEIVRRVRQATLGAWEHQDVPFDRVVAALRPERTLSHTPVYQVLFELLNEGGPGTALPELPGLSVRGQGTEVVALKCDLSIVLSAGPSGLNGTLLYSTELFERATARRLVGHLERVLEQAVADPGLPLSRFELGGADERLRVAEWNRTAAAFPSVCIHTLFEARARETPGAPAVIRGGTVLSFGEVERRANRLARYLAGIGVGPEVRVGICLERTPDLPVAILAVMKAGGAWVPVDPAHPAERIAYVLDDSGVAAVLTESRLEDRVPRRDGVAVVRLDGDAQAIAAESGEPVESGVTPWNLAYVIYTSGSTGRPKGVAMHHRGVVNYVDWGTRFYGAGQGNGAPVFTSVAVDLTLTSFLPLFAGRPVHLLPEESPVEALAGAIRGAPGFGPVKITPIHLALLNDLLSPAEMAGAAHTLVIGADFLSAEPTLPWQREAPGVRLINEYGPTETVVGCSAYVLPAGAHRAGPVPVGRAIQNMGFHVLDARMRPVPVGLPGELYIGGVGVARGYLGRPGLTAEKFVPDPLGAPGERMYRTGDRARWLPGGELTILGRTDHQVKVRGYRVEPGEIEAALRAAGGVRECLVAVREDRPGDRRLVAYVVGDADAGALRARLLESLPAYMVPDAFVPLAALPHTRTGKVDPKTLPPPDYAGAGDEGDGAANEVEAELVEIWETLLDVPGIGVTQSFFDLGGNSLLALRMFTQVRRRLGCDLPLATLFAGATIRHMAAAILEQRGAAPTLPPSIVPLQPLGTLPPVFLIHAADRNVVAYVNLVRHVGAAQPAYGVRDLGDMARPVERIAAEHLQAIRAVQPHGPYALAGWSFGGVVAFEAALQLQRAGETVAFVGLIDTMSPRLMREWSWASHAQVVHGMAHEAAEQNGRALRLTLAELEPLDEAARVRHAASALRAQGAVPPDHPDAALEEAVGSVQARLASALTYQPGCFGGTLTLFRAADNGERHERFFATRDPAERRTLGWAPLATEAVDVREIPGTHVTIGSEPNVATLARQLRAALAAGRSRASAAGPMEPAAPAASVDPAASADPSDPVASVDSVDRGDGRDGGDGASSADAIGEAGPASSADTADGIDPADPTGDHACAHAEAGA